MVKGKIAYKSTEMIQLKGDILKRDALTEQEQKAVMYIAYQVKEGNKEGDSYFFEYKKFAEIAGIEINGRLYKEMLDLLYGLQNKRIMFRSEKEKGIFMGTMIVSPRFYDSGVIEYQIDRNLLPHFKSFSAGFTIIDVTDYMRIRGKYPLSLYELMLSWASKGKVKYTVQELREKLSVPSDAYQRANDFMKKIRSAIDEINEKSQKIHIDTIETLGARKTVEAIEFKITKLNQAAPKTYEEELESRGQTSIMDVLDNQTATVEENHTDLRGKPHVKCPKCDGKLIKKENKQDHSFFWGCNKQKITGCNYTVNEDPHSEAGEVAMQETKKKVPKSHKEDCPKCKGTGYYEVPSEDARYPNPVVRFCDCNEK